MKKNIRTVYAVQKIGENTYFLIFLHNLGIWNWISSKGTFPID